MGNKRNVLGSLTSNLVSTFGIQINKIIKREGGSYKLNSQEEKNDYDFLNYLHASSEDSTIGFTKVSKRWNELSDQSPKK